MSANVEPSSVFKERSTAASWFSIPKRYVQALLASIALFILYWMRTSFVAALIYILTSSHSNEQEIHSWTYTDVGWMDSAFTWGFTAAQIPGALLTIKFSSHRILLVSMIVTTVFHTIVPLSLSSSAPSIVIVRFLQGIAEGPIYPACLGIWQSWAPPAERTTLFSIVLCGSFFGSVAGLPLNTVLAENFGAKACFFISSISGLIWCLVWSTQTYESPSSHPHISHCELAYLEENVDADNRLEVTVKSVPWKSILTSLPVWAVCMANFCYVCSEYILTISPYLYCRIELEFEKDHTILDILLPNIILGVIVSTSGFLADFLVNRVHLSRNVVRKLYCCGAFTLHGIAFLIIRYYQNIVSTVICINLAHGFLGLSVIGFLVNCLDLSTCYASVVMALCQVFGNLGDMLFPVLLRNMWSEDITGWSTIFDGIISMSFVTALAYAFFGSGNMQWWGKPEAVCMQAGENELGRSTYYSYPDGEDCIELVVDRQEESSKASTELQKEKY